MVREEPQELQATLGKQELHLKQVVLVVAVVAVMELWVKEILG